MLASHLIFTCYGFWLPNDPRGSGSDWVRSIPLLRHGHATRVTHLTKRSVAAAPHDPVARERAKRDLRYPVVEWSDAQIDCVGRGFERAVLESGYAVLALAVLRDHTHVVVAHHDHAPQQIMGHLKARATRQLLLDGLHPFGHLAGQVDPLPSCWASRGWKVFLDTPRQVSGRIKYVQDNLAWGGLPDQSWSFVQTQ